MLKKLNKKGLFSVILVVIGYEISRIIKDSPSLPALKRILLAGKEVFGDRKFYINLCYTLKIVLLGVLISFVFGTILACVCAMNEHIAHLIMPIINSTKNIPSIALFPLFIVLMGIGDAPRIFVIVWNSVYPIISSTLKGLNSVDDDVVDAARNCGASDLQVFVRIKIPLGALDTLNGLKISVGNGFIAIVVAEMLGATKGLGYMVLWSANAFRYPEMYIYILVIALIGLAINVVIDAIISKTERVMFYESKKNVGFSSRRGFSRLLLRRMRKEKGTEKGNDEVCRPQGL